MTRALALWTVEAGRAELREETLPTPGPNQLQVTTLFSGISRGTESLVFAGRVPPSEFERMRAPFQQGSFPFPVKYGYANVGRVSGGDANRVGQLVFTLFPHQDHFVVDATAVRPLPEGLDPRRAVLGANMETALNAVWDAAPLPGDRISIVGMGALGALLASILSRYPELDVEVVDVLPERRALANAMQVPFVMNGRVSAGRDIVFHTSASSAGLQTSLESCRNEGKVVELSWYGDRDVNVPLGGAFHSQRLQLVCSQVGRVSPNKPGWTYGERMDLALKLLRDDRLDALLADPIPFAKLPGTLPDLFGSAGASNHAPAHVVEYPSSG